MRLGAEDYVCKPFNLDEVALNVEKTLEKKSLEKKIKEFQEQLNQKSGNNRHSRLGLYFSVQSKHWSSRWRLRISILPGIRGG